MLFGTSGQRTNATKTCQGQHGHLRDWAKIARWSASWMMLRGRMCVKRMGVPNCGEDIVGCSQNWVAKCWNRCTVSQILVHFRLGDFWRLGHPDEIWWDVVLTKLPLDIVKLGYKSWAFGRDFLKFNVLNAFFGMIQFSVTVTHQWPTSIIICL